MKSKLNGDDVNESIVKEEVMLSENNEKMTEEQITKSPLDSLLKCDATAAELNFESLDQTNNNAAKSAATFFPDFKDGSSDSDSSAILNEDNNSPTSSAGVLIHSHQFIPSSVNCFQFSSTNDSKEILGDAQKAYQPQFVKIEEHNFFSGDDSCNFFSDDQAPSLQWYCHDQWN